ncbi:MAG: hypothetical protein J7M26_03550 [Armatimonadetes bacterium]|nr:hypothetical protein [Armatimonadota bacterium]
MLRIPEHTVGRQNDAGLVFVFDRDTEELVGLMVLDFWARFVRRDGTLDEEALLAIVDAPFSTFVDDIRRLVLAQ